MSEFDRMTPAETEDYIAEFSRGRVETAWHHAIFQRMDVKKFPKTLEKLFEPAKSGMDNLIAAAKSMKANQEREARLARKGKTGTRLREE